MDETDDTGLATLAVVKPTLTEEKLVKLANELAKAQLEPADLYQAFDITAAQFEQYIKPNPYFKQAYAAAILEWQSATSAVKRIKIKSATSLEQSLPMLHNRLNSATETLPAVVETAKLLAKLAGAGEEKPQTGSSERFSITINVGSKKIDRTIEPSIDITPQRELEKPHE